MTSLPVKTIKPGELHVSENPCRIKTLLGSCVSVTVHNSNGGFGGMNHFMLPEAMPSRKKGPRDFRFGDLSTRHLIERMLEYDSERTNLEVKIFGGGRVVSALSNANIGRSNVECARSILAEYGLSPEKEYVSGDNGLKLDFNTQTNVVKVRKITNRNRDTGDQPEDEPDEIRKTDKKIVEILSSEDKSNGIDFLTDEGDSDST